MLKENKENKEKQKKIIINRCSDRQIVIQNNGEENKKKKKLLFHLNTTIAKCIIIIHIERDTHTERNNTNKIQTQKNLKLFSQDNRKKERKRKKFEKFFISIFCFRFLYVADFFACSVNSFWLKVKSCKKKIRKQQKKKNKNLKK